MDKHYDKPITVNGLEYHIDTPASRLEAIRAVLSDENDDTEVRHMAADIIVYQAVKTIEPELAELFRDMGKWYA